jgi:alkylhydroperoxidase family enzyme
MAQHGRVSTPEVPESLPPESVPAPISRFPVPAREDLPPDLRERFDTVEEKSGFLPNVFAALSWRPTEAAAFFAMHDALMDKETPGLSNAVLEVAVRLAVEPAAVTAQDLADLRAHGLTEDDVWDVGAIVSFFALSNRLAHWAAIPPNPEFFLLGRVPRA